MKILITGANGLLGQHLVKLFCEQAAYTVIATAKGESRLPDIDNKKYRYYPLDITDGMAVNNFITTQAPAVIIHAAAKTQVDECELNPVECWDTNVTATRFLLEAAKAINAFFVFVSTDFVFDGATCMYKEDSEMSPVNYYGSSKVAAEKAVELSGLDHAIVRTCLVYGNILRGNRSNIISWVKENLEKKLPIKVVSDQVRTPTYVKDLAKGILLIVEKRAGGVYHISGNEVMTPYDMAMAVAEYLKLDKGLITKVNADSFTQVAKRPAKTGFVIDKASDELGYRPVSFLEGMREMLC